MKNMYVSQTVEPIRNKKSIDAIKKYLKGGNERDYILFTLGINSGLRISDLLKLKVNDVYNKDRIVIKEKKTGKIKNFRISTKIQKSINTYIEDNNLKTWLFKSRKTDAFNNEQPITRVQAYG